jgi:hypothetical protein
VGGGPRVLVLEERRLEPDREVPGMDRLAHGLRRTVRVGPLVAMQGIRDSITLGLSTHGIRGQFGQ